MSDLTTLQQAILTAITDATDEAALESVRIAALGKAGSISALLKSLGGMSPDERKEKGPQINGLRDIVNDALLARRTALKDQALNARLQSPAGNDGSPVATHSTTVNLSGQLGEWIPVGGTMSQGHTSDNQQQGVDYALWVRVERVP